MQWVFHRTHWRRRTRCSRRFDQSCAAPLARTPRSFSVPTRDVRRRIQSPASWRITFEHTLASAPSVVRSQSAANDSSEGHICRPTLDHIYQSRNDPTCVPRTDVCNGSARTSTCASTTSSTRNLLHTHVTPVRKPSTSILN